MHQTALLCSPIPELSLLCRPDYKFSDTFSHINHKWLQSPGYFQISFRVVQVEAAALRATDPAYRHGYQDNLAISDAATIALLTILTHSPLSLSVPFLPDTVVVSALKAF